jgi:hypothetical protein
MYALFFHRLSILERATDHECINNCSYSKRNVGRIPVQQPCEFFLREEVFQIQHMRFPALPPPFPPTKLLLLYLVTPPPSSVVVEAGTSLALGLRQGCSLQRRVTHQI